MRCGGRAGAHHQGGQQHALPGAMPGVTELAKVPRARSMSSRPAPIAPSAAPVARPWMTRVISSRGPRRRWEHEQRRGLHRERGQQDRTPPDVVGEPAQVSRDASTATAYTPNTSVVVIGGSASGPGRSRRAASGRPTRRGAPRPARPAGTARAARSAATFRARPGGSAPASGRGQTHGPGGLRRLPRLVTGNLLPVRRPRGRRCRHAEPMFSPSCPSSRQVCSMDNRQYGLISQGQSVRGWACLRAPFAGGGSVRRSWGRPEGDG